MYKKEIAAGKKFGEWTVLETLKERKNGYLLYRVKCSCGTEAIHNGNYLRDEKSPYCRSCSARKKMKKGKKCLSYRHGATLDLKIRPTYKVWVVMKQRCNNPNDRSYHNYGGRGIYYDESWNDFETFLKDMGVCPKGLSLERIDNDKNYSKENCKWATRKEQNNNRRDNTFFIIDGKRVVRTQIQEQLNWTRDMWRRRMEKYGADWIIDQYRRS